MAKSRTSQNGAKSEASAIEVINNDGNNSRFGASPSFFLLRHVAESISGGVETMVTLASLSRDERVRAVARRWTSLSRKAKQSVEFEELCRFVGTDGGHFFGAIAATAFELGMDVSGFIGGLECWTIQVPTFLAQTTAAKGAAIREQFFKAGAFWTGTTMGLECEPGPLERAPGRRGASKRIGRGARVASAEGRRNCAEMALFRRKWKLSQRQFASLFVTSTRTVRHWERGEFSPSPQQQRFLGLLIAYVRLKGLGAFHKRFIGEAPRYSQAGRRVLRTKYT